VPLQLKKFLDYFLHFFNWSSNFAIRDIKLLRGDIRIKYFSEYHEINLYKLHMKI